MDIPASKKKNCKNCFINDVSTSNRKKNSNNGNNNIYNNNSDNYNNDNNINNINNGNPVCNNKLINNIENNDDKYILIVRKDHVKYMKTFLTNNNMYDKTRSIKKTENDDNLFEVPVKEKFIDLYNNQKVFF